MQHHPIHLLFLSLYIGLTASSASTGPFLSHCSSQRASEGLAQAIARADRVRALELVGPILEDEAGGEYRFDYEARWNAENAIRDLRLVETIPLLRKVASLSYSASVSVGSDAEVSRRDLLKIFAIKSALSSLMELGDSEAVRLNRLHVASPVISSTSIRNLMQINDWGATEQIRKVLAERELTPDAFLDLSAGLAFLVASPEAQPHDCVLLRRLNGAYGVCFDAESQPPGVAGCEDFVRTAQAFEARFRCEADRGRKSQER